MHVTGKRLVSLLVMAVMAVGCGKSKNGESGETISPADRIVNEAMAKAESGQTDAALAMLEQGLAEVTDESGKSRLFGAELNLLLSQGRLSDAQARYLKALATPAEALIARQTLGMVEDYLSRQPDGYVQLLAWCDELDKADLLEDMRTAVLQNRLQSHLALGQFEPALTLIETRAWALPDEIVSGMAGRFLQAAIAAGRYDEADKAIALLETKGEKRAGMAAMAAGGRIELALAHREFAAAGELLFAKAAAFDDNTAAGTLDRIARAAAGGGKPEVADAFMEKALTLLADRPVTSARAARWWILTARDSGSLETALDRLDKLNAMGLPPAVLVSCVSMVSQLVLAPGTKPAAVSRMLDFATALKPQVEGEGDRSLLAGVQLDAGFRLEDYAALVKVLEEGVPGHDKAWHDTMINKVLAHLDLKEGRIDEAVKRFRGFMASIEAQADQGHRDPVTDERVTKDMILGYNARRIGDIYAKANRADEAAKAYAEATADYEKALEGFAQTDPEYKTVTGILAELGARKGG
jgi:tetratricopeptide (TPR) repeat protein